MQLLCPTPNITAMTSSAAEQRRKRQTGADSYRLGFLMDGVTELLVNASDGNAATIEIDVVVDPVFFDFADRRKTYVVDSDSSLEIEVRNRK